ncbi:uncharacterized protein ARMOST_22126 [Armillaria ostoyae]|uniref:Uncharacterized protein n=1 Tax=Armillaria ostoyae TaxID=47428 RepID=A0A284SC01_ARMOS|nr:uncharacterized protein ARMOST_22126 [Armillaria ostoyae]
MSIEKRLNLIEHSFSIFSPTLPFSEMTHRTSGTASPSRSSLKGRYYIVFLPLRRSDYRCNGPTLLLDIWKQ